MKFRMDSSSKLFSHSNTGKTYFLTLSPVALQLTGGSRAPGHTTPYRGQLLKKPAHTGHQRHASLTTFSQCYERSDALHIYIYTPAHVSTQTPTSWGHRIQPHINNHWRPFFAHTGGPYVHHLNSHSNTTVMCWRKAVELQIMKTDTVGRQASFSSIPPNPRDTRWVS